MSKKQPSLRARDSDRADACGVIDAALADEQLTAAEHAARTARAMRAETFADLDREIGDLQLPHDFAATPLARGTQAPRWRKPVAFIAACALAVGLGFVSAKVVDWVAKPDYPDLTTADGLSYFLDRYRAEFGETTADDVTLYPRYASFSRAGSSYTFRGDFASSGRDTRKFAHSFDLAKVDLATYARVYRGAPTSLYAPGATVAYALIRLDPSSKKDPDAEISLYVKDSDVSRGYVKVSFAGAPIGVYPS
ncbi:DUF1707 domain-containing protein [Nocardia camponoti]|uniref:DUF1707 domain-containing protein n=1 Tax=Nocardia camponoti TaxID=1616106 RepID=A0A917QJP9_9NOCA|nr:DUF1707 domain-containing protein [Nocardia camponoti]GGK53689.1 hypothetical protein GCM10011591_26890 [Nocardia camponoti]